MAKSDVEKYPTILSAFEKFLADEGLEANDEDWNVMPEYYDQAHGCKIRPFTIKTTDGKTVGLGLSENVAEYNN